ncbi:hypothetical protein KPH14_008596 [Odynerus spinipes]|uniref:CHK kinase-like domain-containing protein n=1 Tax=Odynerus spinipes TaxID=1348599 RepID=A0AAD9RSC9_9HYME|nr:hypothetical protein KPH14_008596 [Odynerus spinipes]
MEQRSMSEIIKALQPLLRKFENDDGLVIEEAIDEAGSKLGDNYTSIMIRTKIVGRYGNGSPYRKSFMTKILPRERAINQLMKVHDLFALERYVYENILPVLGDFGPRCVYAGREEVIMEDLREKGYNVCERRDYLDLDHCLYALKALAKFHAKSLAIKIKDPETFKKLIAPVKETIFHESTGPAIGKSIDTTVGISIEHLESIKPRTAELEKAIEYMKSFEGNCYDKMKDLINLPKEKNFLILHGDPWENNILFKHDGNGKIVDLKFVDYQIVRHLSPAMDFHYFVYTSARNYVIEKHYDQLVEEYHRTFSETLKESGVPEEHRQNLGMEWFKSELNRFCLYGLFTGFWLVHAILADESNLLDMDKITVEEIESLNVWSNQVVPIKAERIKVVSLHFMRTYKR